MKCIYEYAYRICSISMGKDTQIRHSLLHISREEIRRRRRRRRDQNANDDNNNNDCKSRFVSSSSPFLSSSILRFFIF